MKHTKQHGAFLFILSLLFLCSCGDSSDAASQGAVQVSETIRASVVPMEAIDTIATRANIDKTAAEKVVKTAYVVQFNGTSATSTATWVSGDVAANLKSSSSVDCSLLLTSGVKNRVYVVANPKSVPVVGTTLGAFETVAYTVTTTLPATGLPMAAFQDVALGDKFNLFQLKSPLARLTFTSTGALTLRGVPSAYSLATGDAGATAVRPSGVTYTNTATLTSGTTYYVPANLSGQVGLSSPELRCSLFAPANAMYVAISANNVIYNIYLGDGSTSDFNVAGNFAYTFNISLNSNVGGDLRLSTSTLTDLSASGTANCYIATAANKWYSFDGTVMGNGKSTPLPANMASNSVASAIVPTALNPVSTDVLWETWNTAKTPIKGTVVKEVCVINGKVVFRTGAYEGNAVVTARDASNTIIWSWHIWRINTDPTLAANTATTTSYTSSEGTFDDTGTTTHPGITMMKLNLGALSVQAASNLSIGLYYQWGRKDPFPAFAGLTAPNNVAMATVPAGIPIIPSAEARYTVAQSIAQPTTFFKFSGDWCITRNDNLWGTPLTNKVISQYYNSNPGSKSIYDPCPAGWRVPPAYVYANATKDNCPWANNTGRDFKGIFNGTSVWFPASGFRYDYSGSLVFVGTDAYYWTSSPNASDLAGGHRLYFVSYNVAPNGSGYRSNGFVLRCVKE